MRPSRKRIRSAPASRSKSTARLRQTQPTPAPEREELAAALQAANGYARRLLEACPMPLLVLDAAGQVTDLNQAAALLLGLNREKLLGSDFSAYFSQPEQARSALEETCSRGFVTGLALALRHASGLPTGVLFSAQAHRDTNHELVGVFAVLRDLGSETRQQAELVGLQAQLTENLEELKRREFEIQQISRLYDVLQTCNLQKEAYPAIASVSAQLFPECAGALAMVVDGKHTLETVAEWGRESLLLSGFAVDDCWALRRGQKREVQQPGTPLECRHFRSVPRAAYICLPLSVRGELQGLLHLEAAPGLRIGERQSRLLATLGEVVKLSLSNLKLREVLREQATTDPLTGLFNRNYLEGMLRRELTRSQRSRTPLCVALLDIDGFKAFNDRLGHEAGDAALKALAGFFQTKLRGSDIAGRYGGDEFLLVLLDTSAEQVLARLEQLCAEIRRIEPAYEGLPLPPLSVSMGVAEWPRDFGSLEQLIRAADQALYDAKAGGRNRIELYGRSASEKAGAPPHLSS